MATTGFWPWPSTSRRSEPDLPAIFVTKDTNLRIKADAIGLVAEDYESDKVAIEELYQGYRRT